MKRIAVMTGGGDCPGLNAVIRAVTRTATLKYGWEVLGIQKAFLGLLASEEDPQVLTLDAIRGILPQGGTMLGTTNRAHPFRFPIKHADGTTTYEDRSDALIERLDELGIEALVMIGGDGTMGLAHQLSQKGVKIVGVPKTIDNDLSATDYTFGFDSACNIAMEAIDRLHTTAYSHSRVMLCEVMGRYAGWIALHAGMAGGADVILLPEMPYDIDVVAQKIQSRADRGRPFSIVVVAEGAKPREGTTSYMDQEGYNKRLGGAAARAAEDLQGKIDLEIRCTVLGHIQRGGSPTHFDRVLGTRFGAEAIELIARGEFGRMVSLQGKQIGSCDLQDAIGKLHTVDPEGQLVQSARALGISFGV